MLSILLISALASTSTASPATALVSRQTIVTDLPANWSFFGCFEENLTGPDRTLNAASSTNDTMTIESCVDFCNSQSFTFAGLEFGSQCFCDNVFEEAAVRANDTDCSMACAGNPDELCGAANRLSVYTSGVPASFPAEVLAVGPWTAVGCFNDSIDLRILTESIFNGLPAAENLTAASCTTACQDAGFTLAGLEFGEECWCGTHVANGGVFVGNSNGISGTNPPVRTTVGGPFCDTACTGNAAELCGGSDRMNLYNFTAPASSSVSKSSTVVSSTPISTVSVSSTVAKSSTASTASSSSVASKTSSVSTVSAPTTSSSVASSSVSTVSLPTTSSSVAPKTSSVSTVVVSSSTGTPKTTAAMLAKRIFKLTH
ncbi:WSC-domain-containing protein [Ramaria rubella]|nr:WSC-domain-containing protein [Ramaria rubella]